MMRDCACAHSVMSHLAIPCTLAYQAPLSMGFPRQEHLSGLPFPTPGDLPDSGTETLSPALQAGSGFFAAAPLGESYQDANIINVRREPCASSSKQPQM